MRYKIHVTTRTLNDNFEYDTKELIIETDDADLVKQVVCVELDMEVNDAK